MLAGALFACGNDPNSLVMRKIATFIGISINLICKDILHCGLCWGERERGCEQSFVGVDPDGDPRHRIVDAHGLLSRKRREGSYGERIRAFLS
ncbi:uncharacterized protein K452DRAFT_51596 [Aplosporella prunicola CBS 121167]|uniref:Uncharacterized protein n=1 Tax=Aplosporella prunicola CBS 121167 TaxID=1176127 RepID=A0A6A6AVG3_9PEZI|nr:uncharacterized protein K452DRAFT_51596 [Aplosporella prunicola CBS 121167]KAF2135183.1 hypothetical protein K452DRAFT_51596 [Aplosporella prunicola CBS 121167]